MSNIFGQGCILNYLVNNLEYMYINLFSELLRDYCTKSNFAETFEAFGMK